MDQVPPRTAVRMAQESIQEKPEIELPPNGLVQNHPSSGRSHIPELDGLRGIAIATVVYFHYVVLTGLSLPYPLEWFNRTIGTTFSCGVDLFFVLSGFLIGGILIDARESNHYFRTFYIPGGPAASFPFTSSLSVDFWPSLVSSA